MPLVPVGICYGVQTAADNGLRLFAFCCDDRLVSLLAFTDVYISADEIVEIGPLHQELGHQRVVVVLCGDVAVGAALGLFATHRMRETRTEGLAAVTLGGNRLLLEIDPLAVRVLRAYQDRASGPHRREAASSD